MGDFITLENHLNDFAQGAAGKRALADTVMAIADACRTVSDLIAQGAIAGDLAAAKGDNEAGDVQKELDILANEILIKRLRSAPVAFIASEELDDALVTGAEDAIFCLAIDPLDGSSNIDTNVSIGTIFSILPLREGADTEPAMQFMQPGSAQLAAGYVIYGPQTALVLSLGEGSHVFTLDRATSAFRLTAHHLQIPENTREFAINASNYRHWEEWVRLYIDDCLDGADGARGKDFNTRWVASLVAECHRILSRGGVFLYPSDERKGYEHGRLRLLYEANPIAMLVEQAGGAASTGGQRILDVEPEALHQRVPLIFGSAEEVARIERYFREPDAVARHSPLFGRRGLFRT